MKDNVSGLKEHIEQFNKIINDCIEKLNKVKNMMGKFYEIIGIIYNTINPLAFIHSSGLFFIPAVQAGMLQGSFTPSMSVPCN